MAAAQDAAEVAAARLLAEDAGVRALLAMREPMPTAPTDAVFEQIKSLRRVDPFVKAAFGARLNHPDVEVLSVLVVSLSEDRERLLKENIHHRMASAAGDVGCPEGIAGIAKTWRERAEAAEERIAEGRATALESVFALIHSRLHLDPFINAAFRSRVASPDGEVLGALICQLSDERARLCRSMEANERWAMPPGAQNAGFADTIARAARCEAAEARVAELEEALRWIPVTELLPAHGDTVLVYGPMDDPIWVASYSSRGVRPAWWGEGGTSLRVTHWRPLPAGPEVKS